MIEEQNIQSSTINNNIINTPPPTYNPINNKKRLGSDITCTAGNNIVGKIGNTPDGHVEGFQGV
jgi:hypothetical protein